MGAFVFRNMLRPSALDLESILPQCAWEHCHRRRGRWQGLLHRGEGVRCGGEWYCSPECLQEHLALELQRLLHRPAETPDSPGHRVPLGLLLLSRGHVDHDALQQALAMQRSDGARIGDCLRKITSLTEQQIANALAQQWSCPVYPPGRGSECRSMVPQHLQEFHRMLPVHFVESTRDLYIAFEQFVDYTVLLAIESMLQCHTRPCVLEQSEIRRRLGEEYPSTGNTELVLASTITPQELARIICSYVLQTGAEHVRLLGCGVHIWARLEGDRSLDLLVRRRQE